MIKIFNPTEHRAQLEALQTAANILTALSKNGTHYEVETRYFNHDQRWKWTTIVAYAKDGTSRQILCPRDHSIITDIGTLEAIVNAVENIINRKSEEVTV